MGRVQFEVFEKFTSAYLFQIAREKSCYYLLRMSDKQLTVRFFFALKRSAYKNPIGPNTCLYFVTCFCYGCSRTGTVLNRLNARQSKHCKVSTERFFHTPFSNRCLFRTVNWLRKLCWFCRWRNIRTNEKSLFYRDTWKCLITYTSCQKYELNDLLQKPHSNLLRVFVVSSEMPSI